MSIEPLEVPPSPSSTSPSVPISTDPLPDELLETMPGGAGEDDSTTPSPRGRRRDDRLRARKVTRVIRRVEPWTVLRVSAVLYVCLWLVVTVAGTILWQVARATGTLDNVQDFLATALADDTFTIDGGRVLLSTLLGGVVLVFAGTGLTVLLAVLFNLVSELTGGVRLSVVELETATAVGDHG
jgi:hypothetical protein